MSTWPVKIGLPEVSVIESVWCVPSASGIDSFTTALVRFRVRPKVTPCKVADVPSPTRPSWPDPLKA